MTNYDDQLFEAIINGCDPNTIKQCLDNGADPNAVYYDGFTTPLFFIASHKINFRPVGIPFPNINGEVASINLLVQYSADVNKACIAGTTPLHAAIKRGRFEIAEALLNNNADPNAADEDKRTPIFYFFTKTATNIELLDLLLRFGADINWLDYGYSTVLYYAVRQGNLEVIKKCIEYGVDLNHKDGGGWTALDYAKVCRRSIFDNKIVNFLKKAMKNADLIQQMTNQAVPTKTSSQIPNKTSEEKEEEIVEIEGFTKLM